MYNGKKLTCNSTLLKILIRPTIPTKRIPEQAKKKPAALPNIMIHTTISNIGTGSKIKEQEIIWTEGNGKGKYK